MEWIINSYGLNVICYIIFLFSGDDGEGVFLWFRGAIKSMGLRLYGVI